MGATSAHSRTLSTSSTKWSGWLDSNQRPPASEAGTLAGLSYTLLALRREIESLSPVRQTGRLTRCVTERDRISSPCALAASRNEFRSRKALAFSLSSTVRRRLTVPPASGGSTTPDYR